MNKAEDRAQVVYPAWRNGIGDEFSQNSAYYGFIEGYHQAEKDNELTWEDIKLLDKIFINEKIMSGLILGKKEYEEILKRFKEKKEKIDN